MGKAVTFEKLLMAAYKSTEEKRVMKVPDPGLKEYLSAASKFIRE